MKDKIIEGLRKLNVENDNHWTADGLPKIEALKFTVGPSVTREDVNSVAPGFTRSNPVIEDVEHEEKHDTSSLQETEQTEVVADTDNAQYESLSKAEADKETVNGKSIVTTRIALEVNMSDAVKAMLKDIPDIDFDTVSVEELKEYEKFFQNKSMQTTKCYLQCTNLLNLVLNCTQKSTLKLNVVSLRPSWLTR